MKRRPFVRPGAKSSETFKIERDDDIPRTFYTPSRGHSTLRKEGANRFVLVVIFTVGTTKFKKEMNVINMADFIN